MKLRSIIENKNIRNKKVFLRVDFNVAIEKGKIVEAYRIDRSLPTIKYLLDQKNQVIIGTHFGRPEGKFDKKYSLAPIVRLLKSKMKKIPVSFITEPLTEAATIEKIRKSQKSVVILENLRFYPGEEDNDLNFAKILAGLADVYVNDAFAVCHRQAASTVAITKILPSYAGLNLLDEVKFLSQTLKPKKPAIAIVGGVKLDSKFGVIKNFLKKYDKILTGGGVANLMLQAQGYKIGGSITDKNFLTDAQKLKNNKKIFVPSDFIVANAKNTKQIYYKRSVWGKVLAKKDEMILDIGTDTVKQYANEIEKAKTIVWVGPMGKIDDPRFSGASEFLARIIASHSLDKGVMSVVGGGETVAVINRIKVDEKITFISTGGGAMLEFLEGKILPGVKPLIK